METEKKGTMKIYQKILEARRVLGIPEQASLAEIKTKYRKLIKKWHPDINQENKDQCDKMAKKIIDSYAIILGYCKEYKISFSQEEVQKYLPAEEWWADRFGDDPIR
jgi:preprotein translocase subunit Sec63